jgi:uracil DNA glycosylase
MRFIKVEVIKNFFSINFSELAAYYNQKEDIVFIDSLNEDQMYLAPFDYISYIDCNPELEDLTNKVVVVPFACNCNYADKQDLNLLKKFHYSWFNELRPFLKSKEFIQILIKIKKLREKEEVYPQQNLVFSEFLTNLNKVKGVWFGEYPYLNYKDANGRSFSTWERATPKVLNTLKEGIRDDLELTHYNLSNDLLELSNKGILLLNYSLIINQKKDMIDITLPFIKEVIKVLNKKEKLSCLFLGSNAQKLVSLFNKDFNIHTTEYPNEKWNTNNVFKNFNNHLNIKI